MPLPRECDVAIVGAGAAGLATAIFTRQFALARPPSTAERGAAAAFRPTVVVLEGARKPGAKILVSGGSRCNVTNVTVSERDYWSAGRPAVVRRILRALPVAQTVEWFRAMGVPLHEEADGKLFPDSNRARDVLQALLDTMTRVGAALITDARVEAIDRAAHGEHFQLTTGAGPLRAQTVVLATGGRSLPRSGSDGAGYAMATALGHHLVATTPALAPLTLAWDGARTALHQRLTGVAHPVELSVWVQGSAASRFTGSMLWTHFGVSGPVALNASRHIERARLHHQDVRVTINFFPGQTFDLVDRHLTAATGDHPKMMLQSLLAQSLPASVAEALLHDLRLDPSAPLAQLVREHRRRLSHALVEWELHVSGTRGYTYAEATAGGIDLAEIDPATMASRPCPGLYLVGELLDVDGRLGGFNFQWAWASAFVAGRALAARFAPGVGTAAASPAEGERQS